MIKLTNEQIKLAEQLLITVMKKEPIVEYKELGERVLSTDSSSSGSQKYWGYFGIMLSTGIAVPFSKGCNKRSKCGG